MLQLGKICNPDLLKTVQDQRIDPFQSDIFMLELLKSAKDEAKDRTRLLFLGTIILHVLLTIKPLFGKRKRIHKPFHKALLRHFPYQLPKELESNTKKSKVEEKKNYLHMIVLSNVYHINRQ